ncbi:TetR/AcrR family transcriptional regulator [Clostridium sp. CX1]|uniref:TetR/AcrR family transcriptional regulator n=1 Tax=Clostridium tanneri TaxID=3037988 RepID=A0ABU4JQR7_9CLOT|nr:MULTISPECIES: TetR/AcrR family transcriptional regulator [unclassified Clostridium]MCT8978714.1 TetR/AcrR family transcriptional regulator [Clostridium sp. CX1]MDW8800494.1 TetR/AcrR family transcriptional regulator [Clostridium sp. A1-XYC3]
MKEKFESLPEEKKKRILDASIEEFAINGYDKASTNSIVKKAEISKGLLFHYFGSKKSLFLYVFDYCVNDLTSRYYLMKKEEPKDIFERFMWFSVLKIKTMHQEPLMSRLVFSAVSNMPKELSEELTEKYKNLFAKHMPLIMGDIDTSKFRKDIDSQKAVELIMIFMDGIANKYLQKYRNKPADEVFNDAEKIMEEFNDYINILKVGIYK